MTDLDSPLIRRPAGPAPAPAPAYGSYANTGGAELPSRGGTS